MLPMTLLRHWQWENSWLVFSLVALLIVPWSLALFLIPELLAIYLSMPAVRFVEPVLCGVGWGLAQVLFGLTIARLGLALGYGIVMGFVSVLGTLIPLAAQERTRYESNPLIFWGVGAMALGIAASGWAGRLRERACRAQQDRRSIAYGPALTLAVTCGLLSPMLNYAFVFSEPIRSATLQRGTSAAIAGYAIWPIVLTAGFLPNVAYSVYLLRKNQTGRLFKYREDVTPATVMGILWMGSLALYGMSTARMGDLGTSVGWGIVQAVALITATILGALRREWAGAGQNAAGLRLAGVGLFMIAIFLMASAALKH
jgi:L-rhamnose-H+ transport protein